MANDNRPASGITGETIVMYLLMALYAVFTTIIGSILTVLIAEFPVSLSQGGIFIAVQNIGCFVGIIAAGVLIDRYAKRRLILVAYSCFAAALVAVAFSTSMAAYLSIIFLAGLAAKFVDATLNSTISRMYEKNKGFYMNLLHCSFGVGSFFGPLFAGGLVKEGYPWRTSYWVLGVVCFAMVLFYAAVIRRKERAGTASSRRQRGVPLRTVLQPRMFSLWLMLFFYCGHEIGINNWLPTYMEETFGSDAVTAASAVSTFWLGLICSRFACSLLTRRVYEKTLLFVGGVLGSALLLAGVTSGSESMVFVGSASAGFFAGATIPMIMTLGFTWHPGAQGKAAMMLFVAITAGSVVFPWLMGIVGGIAGLTAAMVMNGLLLLSVCLLALSLPKRQVNGMLETENSLREQ